MVTPRLTVSIDTRRAAERLIARFTLTTCRLAENSRSRCSDGDGRSPVSGRKHDLFARIVGQHPQRRAVADPLEEACLSGDQDCELQPYETLADRALGGGIGLGPGFGKSACGALAALWQKTARSFSRVTAAQWAGKRDALHHGSTIAWMMHPRSANAVSSRRKINSKPRPMQHRREVLSTPRSPAAGPLWRRCTTPPSGSTRQLHRIVSRPRDGRMPSRSNKRVENPFGAVRYWANCISAARLPTPVGRARKTAGKAASS